jgi:CBS domain-containing protein
MKVSDLMTANPACCTKDTSLRDVAKMMEDCNCGAIPVVQGKNDGHIIGIITDRDIVCRTLADGKDPFQMAVGDCMSLDVVTVKADANLEECSRLMQDKKVRRIPVVDGRGVLRGMVAQADLARQAPQEQTAQVVKEVSKPTPVAAAR